MATQEALWRDHDDGGETFRRTVAPPKWSSDLLDVMNTHLCLLKHGAVSGGRCTGMRGGHCDGKQGGGVFSVESESEGAHCNGKQETESGGGTCNGGGILRVEMANGGGPCNGKESGAMSEDLCVEIDSRAPLPDGWEQFLNIKTGQVYFVDWKSCRRSYTDPRRMRPGLPHGRRWELPAACVTSELSDCVTDACNAGGVCDMETEDDGEVNSTSKLVTASMLEEDWELMRARGWASSLYSTDGQSEIISAVHSQDCVVTQQDGPSMDSMACHHCFFPNFITRTATKPGCSHRGFALG